MDDNLQFDKAELNQPAATTCAMCQAPLRDQYFQAMGKVLCEPCAGQVRQYNEGTGSGPGGFAMSIALGVGAAILGTAVYGAVLIKSNSAWGIISLAIGWLVGRGVRKGSGGRGGLPFQILAAFLTYSSIVGAYAWDALAHREGVTPAIAIVTFMESYRLPFLMGFQNVLSVIIIAFGVWEAWRLNQRTELVITGPHALASAPQIAPGA